MEGVKILDKSVARQKMAIEALTNAVEKMKVEFTELKSEKQVAGKI